MILEHGQDIKTVSLSLAVAVAIVSLSCVGNVVTAHENFKDQLKKAVGNSIDDVYPGSWTYRREPTEHKVLANGNVEYTYLYMRSRSCKFMFEVHPSTRIIVGARFEGKESDCVINP